MDKNAVVSRGQLLPEKLLRATGTWAGRKGQEGGQGVAQKEEDTSAKVNYCMV